jgi:hypothetical protein
VRAKEPNDDRSREAPRLGILSARFPKTLWALLLFNTALTVLTIVASIAHTAGIDRYGLPQYVPMVSDPQWTYLVGSLLFLEGILAFSLFGAKTVYALIILYVFATAMLSPLPSPVDEPWHLAFIKHVSQHARIPSIRDAMPWDVTAVSLATYPQPVSEFTDGKLLPDKPPPVISVIYVAFHPPLYYLVMAVPYALLPDNLIHKMYGLRLLGGLLLLIAAMCLRRTLSEISNDMDSGKAGGIIPFLSFGVVCLICLNPGIVHRMTVLGNIQIGFLLASVIVYMLGRMISRGSWRISDVAILGVLSGLLAVSYYYSVVFFPIIGFWLLWRGNLKQMSVYLFTVCLLASPWLLHNYMTYGTINAGAEARRLCAELGMDIGQYGLQETWNMLTINISRIFLAQESYLYSAGGLSPVQALGRWLAVGSLCAVAACVAAPVFSARKQDGKVKLPSDFFLIQAGVVIGTLAMLAVIAYYSQLGLAIRYGYLMLPSLGVLVYASLNTTTRLVQGLAASIMVFFVSVATANAIAIDVRNADLIPRLFQQTYRTTWLKIEPDERPHTIALGTESFSQSFRAHYDRLCGISLYLCSPPKGAHHRYILRIADESGTILRESEFSTSGKEECSYQDIVFAPINPSRDRTFVFSITGPSLQREEAVLLPLSEPGAYKYGHATIGKERIKEDAVFDTLFRYDVWSTAVGRLDTGNPSVPRRVAGNYMLGELGLKSCANDNVGKIFGDTFQQWFVANANNLCGIRLLVNTFLANPVSSYRLQVFDESSRMIREARMPGAELYDWHYHMAMFGPIPDSAGKRYSFKVVPDRLPVADAITLPLAAPGTYPQGHVVINGRSMNRNVVFDTVYQPPLYEAFSRAVKAR